jgi:hypothetical protein
VKEQGEKGIYFIIVNTGIVDAVYDDEIDI